MPATIERPRSWMLLYLGTKKGGLLFISHFRVPLEDMHKAASCCTPPVMVLHIFSATHQKIASRTPFGCCTMQHYSPLSLCVLCRWGWWTPFENLHSQRFAKSHGLLGVWVASPSDACHNHNMNTFQIAALRGPLIIPLLPPHLPVLSLSLNCPLNMSRSSRLFGLAVGCSERIWILCDIQRGIWIS